MLTTKDHLLANAIERDRACGQGPVDFDVDEDVVDAEACELVAGHVSEVLRRIAGAVAELEHAKTQLGFARREYTSHVQSSTPYSWVLDSTAWKHYETLDDLEGEIGGYLLTLEQQCEPLRKAWPGAGGEE